MHQKISLYWKYERFIRIQESIVGSIIGTTGCFYVMRKEDYHTIPEDSLVDDFEIPLPIIRSGRKSVLCPSALVFDSPEESTVGEYRRKVRTLTGTIYSISRNLWLFNPFRNPYYLIFILHKFARLTVPFLALVCLFSSFSSQNFFVITLMWCQLFFYLCAVIGAFQIPVPASGIGVFCKNLVVLNFAVIHGFFNFVIGNRSLSLWAINHR
jgi:poly-beta-1,6-N-acetyl-D-glucosamine synthase